MKHLVLFCFVGVVVGISGCGRLSDTLSSEPLTDARVSHQNYSLTVDNLSEDMGAGLFDYKNGDSGKFQKELVLRSELKSPAGKNGKSLQSTSLRMYGQTLVVGYNQQGETAEGALDLLSVYSKGNIGQLDGVVFSDMDVNDVDIQGVTVYFTGNKRSDAYTGAYWASIQLQNNAFVLSSLKIIQIPGYTGNAIRVQGNKVFVTSGANGEYAVYDTSGSRLEGYSGTDFRTLMHDAGDTYVLRGDGTVLTDKGTVLFGGMGHKQSDNKLTLFKTPSEQRLFLALGKLGVFSVGIDGQLVASFFLPEGHGNSEDRVANSVLFDSGYLFVSYGGAGLYLTDQDRGTYKWFAKFDDGCSVNHVYVANKILYVAAGAHGVKSVELVGF